MKIQSFLSLKNYTLLLFATGLLGVHILSVNLGFIQLSPYRVLLLFCPFMFFKIKKKTFRQLKSSKNYSYFMFLLFWALYSFLPLLWIEDFPSWAKMYIFLLSGLITSWFIGYFMTSKEDVIKALKVVEVLSVLFGVIAVYEIVTGNYLFFSQSLDYFQERSQLASTIGLRMPLSVFANPNDYALFLLFSIFASLGLSQVKRKTIGRRLSLLLTFCFVFLLLSTQSRSGFIGLLIGFGFYVFIFLLRNRGIKSFMLTMIAVFFVIIFLIPFLINNQDIYQSLLEFDTSSGSDHTRINLIKNGFHFLENSMFLGVGLGNIEYHMGRYGIYMTGSVLNIHNWWMEILVSSGIFVFFFYIFVYLKNLIRLYRFSLTKFDKELQQIATVFFCFFTAFFLASVGASSLMYNEWIWPIMALVMAFVNVFSFSYNKN